MYLIDLLKDTIQWDVKQIDEKNIRAKKCRF
jgi:hypothetical protein